MVFLTYKENDEFNEEIRDVEKDYRKGFALNYLENKLIEKKKKPMYECGKEKRNIICIFI